MDEMAWETDGVFMMGLRSLVIDFLGYEDADCARHAVWRVLLVKVSDFEDAL